MMNNQEQGESVEQSNQPRLCTRGCGFFANPATGMMCSKCYRETVSAEEREKAATAAVAAASTTVPASQPPALSTTAAAPAVAEAGSTAAAVPPPSPSPAVTQQLELPPSSPAASGDDTASAAAPASPPVQKNAGRCFSCNKKVGLTGFKCRCGYVYCGGHRLAEAHNCVFNYKAAERERLARANPLVQAAKVDKL